MEDVRVHPESTLKTALVLPGGRVSATMAGDAPSRDALRVAAVLLHEGLLNNAQISRGPGAKAEGRAVADSGTAARCVRERACVRQLPARPQRAPGQASVAQARTTRARTPHEWGYCVSA